MTVGELIKLLQKCDPNKRVEYYSCSEMIDMGISGVQEDIYKVTIEE